MKNITTIGRILFAIPFAIFGINHFLMTDYYVGMLTSFVPRGAYTIILAGIIDDCCKHKYYVKKICEILDNNAGRPAFYFYYNYSYSSSLSGF